MGKQAQGYTKVKRLVQDQAEQGIHGGRLSFSVLSTRLHYFIKIIEGALSGLIHECLDRALRSSDGSSHWGSFEYFPVPDCMFLYGDKRRAQYQG